MVGTMVNFNYKFGIGKCTIYTTRNKLYYKTARNYFLPKYTEGCGLTVICSNFL